ncbi:MAG: hypothetical protein PWP49_128 [Thermococcaceae archaeon]|jgi:hypothetical protein|uniref:DISARM system helicase DrmA n=1 Tax=Thermococcus sp. PK TaxID=913025 RepID=UPI0005B26788|nr:DISARM system helicase DrmA [Thermococcus sp. PK]KUJ99956.1 MAG: Uncharacterized protein XD43_0383 [Thermococcales archaeon 44_46]MDK2853178.1 hypothetical protein [Thermococcaceae archaeon]MDN5319708.1 hypothetical protein [Thermococcaceae archaeon]HIH73519.1 helicase [Thermococcaceae archaeon]
MGIRSELVADLIAELLGPRYGIEEELPETRKPLTEYVTGILSPKMIPPETVLEYETAEGVAGSEEVTSGFEDEEEDGDVGLNFNPVLDPRTLPRSFGLSFIIRPKTGKTPKLGICVTWARYFWDGDKKVWKRKPRAYFLEIPLKPCNARRKCSEEYCIPDPEKKEVAQVLGTAETELLLKVITRRKEDLLHVSIFVVNGIKKSAKDETVSLHIFQPQLRVRVFNASVVPTTFGENTDEIDFIYRENRAYAKGHMASAVWCIESPENCTDPELRYSDDVPQRPPFKWADYNTALQICKELARKKGEKNPEEIARSLVSMFVPPSPQDKKAWRNFNLIRSEFIPVYALSSPEFGWKKEFGDEPVLAAEDLAEKWDPNELYEALIPLYRGYLKWFKTQVREYLDLQDDREKEIGLRILREIAKTIGRIRRGIRILEKNENARLAFCFANKAMALQFRWQRREEEDENLKKLIWRPYQLAFLLMNIESIVNTESPDREICDLLWIPTGGGKTEAYLALVAFTLAYRRRRALSRIGKRNVDSSGAGTGVISRYTLRLLTIQQFRRALAMITACEYLRTYGLKEGKPPGWRPEKYPNKDEPFLWGGSRFSIGLWVGGGLTPNALSDAWPKGSDGKKKRILGALSILKGDLNGEKQGEPAQILRCPVCGSLLAIPEDGIDARESESIHLTVKSSSSREEIENAFQSFLGGEIGNTGIMLLDVKVHELPSAGFFVITLKFRSDAPVTSEKFDDAWEHLSDKLHDAGVNIILRAARPSRPGYFLISRARHPKDNEKYHDFEIYCPNPECHLNQGLWVEGYPKGSYASIDIRIGKKQVLLYIPGNLEFRAVPDFARANHMENIRVSSDESKVLSYRIPIPALTVDEQLYRMPPSFLIATVDKFAQLSFKPECSGFFGNINAFSANISDFGYGRSDTITGKGRIPVPPFDPPDLILQDELHLISGPLGSMVGIYEIAVDYLGGRRAKYVASTATVKGAEEHVGTLFTRKLSMFPPLGISPGDRFFVRTYPVHPADETKPGRLYVGVLAPGRGPHTPLIRIWARLLQSVYELGEKYPDDLDFFWTLVGYFNSIRELAGALSLYRQDIPERIRDLQEDEKCRRDIFKENPIELSSRLDSTILPSLLKKLEKPYSADAIFTTSMFGTGVDIGRLSLMVVNGQPKTTTSYIQATGRVGRKRAGLVVTFYRATRPRDLSHYEFFIGYHRALDRYVEPSTVSPLSLGTIERAMGPVIVGILRNHPAPQVPWWKKETAHEMADARFTAREVKEIPRIFVERLASFPESRKFLNENELAKIVNFKLDTWSGIAKKEGAKLEYHEYFTATKPVVLGTPAHEYKNLSVVYPNAPTSLRDIEETVAFQVTRFGR